MFNKPGYFSLNKINKIASSLKIPSILIALTVFLSLAGCSKSNFIVLSGTVEATQVDAHSEVAGKIIKLNLEEGSAVKKGDILAFIDSSMQELVVKQQEAVVKLKQARLDELKEGSKSKQLQQAEASVKAAKTKLDELNAGTHPEQLKQAEAAVAAAKAAVETAELNFNFVNDKYNKTKSLYASNATSENDLRDAQYRLSKANQQLVNAREQLRSAQAKLELLKNWVITQSIQAAQANYEQALAQYDLLKNGSTEHAIKAAEADLEHAQVALEQAKLTLSKYQVKSPIDGTFILKNVSIGDVVNPGTSIGTVADLNDLWVKFYIPQKYLNTVSLNQEINLKSISKPDTLMKGKIIFIAGESEFTPKNIETSEAKENTVIRLKVKITDTKGVNLKPGMTVEAYIPLGGK